jgi:VanZ family protein
LNNTLVWSARAGLLIALFVLFVGGHQPGSGQLFTPPWDKVAHCIFYGGLLVIARIAFPKAHLLSLFIFILTVGIADEIHQMFVPGRHPGLDDLAADIFGGVVATLFVKYAIRYPVKV